MSILYVCSVFDSAVQAYSRPFFAPSTAWAVRSFSDEVNRSAADNALFGHPDDYNLCLLASFDEETGIFTAEDHIGTVLIRGKDAKRDS